MDPITPSFADSLAFSLSQIGARSAHLFADRLEGLHITPKAFGVLGNLDTGGGRSQQELADGLGIHRNNMVGLIDDLEAAGWVKRQRSATDRRAFRVELTAAGAAVVASVNGLVPLLDEQIARDLDASERELLTSLLRRVGRTLELTPGVHPHLAGRGARAR